MFGRFIKCGREKAGLSVETAAELAGLMDELIEGHLRQHVLDPSEDRLSQCRQPTQTNGCREAIPSLAGSIYVLVIAQSLFLYLGTRESS